MFRFADAEKRIVAFAKTPLLILFEIIIFVLKETNKASCSVSLSAKKYLASQPPHLQSLKK